MTDAQAPDGNDVWRERVERAALAGDANELKTLFAEAQKLFGNDAGTRWAEALSAVDSSAVTG